MQAILTTIVGLLNYFPGIKTKLAAVAAFILAIIAAWNSTAPEFGLGACHATLAQVAEVVTCSTDWTVHVPDFVNSFVLALLGIGAANSPVNSGTSVKSPAASPTTPGPA